MPFGSALVRVTDAEDGRFVKRSPYDLHAARQSPDWRHRVGDGVCTAVAVVAALLFMAVMPVVGTARAASAFASRIGHCGLGVIAIDVDWKVGENLAAGFNHDNPGFESVGGEAHVPSATRRAEAAVVPYYDGATYHAAIAVAKQLLAVAETLAPPDTRPGPTALSSGVPSVDERVLVHRSELP